MSYHFRLTILCFCIIAVMPIAAACGDDPPAPEPAHITVEEIINQVETLRPIAAGPDFSPAQVGEQLSPGDAVRTLQDSEARVDIVVREYRRVSWTTANTIWRLGQFAVDQDTIIQLDQGTLFVFDEGFQEDRPGFEVVTPAGTASVRGTWMRVTYEPESGVMEGQCFRGECRLANDFGTQLLTDVKKSTVTAQTAPTKPEDMTEEDKAEFTDLPEVKSGEVSIPVLPVPAAAPRATPPPTIPAVAPPPSADLGVSKSGDVDPVAPSGTLIYTVRVDNLGPSDAQGVVVTDILPGGVALVSTNGCEEETTGGIGVPTCTLGTIRAGGFAQYTITVGVEPGASGTLTNTATVSSDTPDPDAANNTGTETTGVITRAEVSVRVAIDFGAVLPGDTVSKEFTVSLTQAVIDGNGTAVASYKIGVTGGNLALCPSTDPCLSFTNSDQGDTVACATMRESTDESDTWTVTLAIPDDAPQIDYSTNITVDAADDPCA